MYGSGEYRAREVREGKGRVEGGSEGRGSGIKERKSKVKDSLRTRPSEILDRMSERYAVGCGGGVLSGIGIIVVGSSY